MKTAALLTLPLLPAMHANEHEVWVFDRLDQIGGHPTAVIGHPQVIDTLLGEAIEFNGVDNILFLHVSRFGGAEEADTCQAIFRLDGGNREHFHELGQCDQVAALDDGKEFRRYIEGALDGATQIQPAPRDPGRIAVVVRMNRRYYFKGEIRMAKFTPRALAPSEFVKLPERRDK